MYNLYWGDTHDNTHQAPDPDFSMDRHLRAAAAHLDFYCGAYYPYTSPAFRKGGHPSEDRSKQPLNVEMWKTVEQLDTEWRSVKDAVRRNHREGEFVIFPGYEWQGDGRWGDHNVFFNEDDPPLFQVETLKELYTHISSRRALAIPHHTAYIAGFRGKQWTVQDDRLSPFMEIFSIHGSSEGEKFGGSLRSNPFMGPDTDAGSFTSAMDRGLKIGVIASTDNWGALAGDYGRGLAAVWAADLTRDALWDAFTSRRVYGVTGDRIRLHFHLNEAPMGSILSLPSRRPVFRVQAEAFDRIDYIDFVRDEVLIDRVSVIGEGASSVELADEFILRFEYGWGPAANVISLPPRRWEGEVRVAGGEISRVVPCWIGTGQEYTHRPDCLTFTGETTQDTVGREVQNGYTLTLKGSASTILTFNINGIEHRATVKELSRGSSVLWDRTASVDLIHSEFGTDPEKLMRKDVLFGMAYKARVHQALPAVVYKKDVAFTDVLFDGKPHSYRIRVRQRNGQMAWSSPIWLE